LTPIIKIEELGKEYPMGEEKLEVLKQINLEVEDGQWLSIIGPSGSGKSTLLHILGCLDVPTSGRYWLDGQEVGSLKEDQLAAVRNRKIGFIFQSFNLLPKLSALENVELPLIYRGLPNETRKEKALAALESVGLKDRLSHLPAQLSGGQQQRVAIARALAGEPQLILADEPTGNLDSRSGEEVLEIIAALHQERRTTIVIITHDRRVARLAQRTVGIRDGCLVPEEEIL